MCPDLDPLDQITEYEFVHTPSFLGWSSTGYIATDNTNHLTILAFRGSHEIGDFIRDAQLVMTSTGLCPVVCLAHSGFWNTWQQSSTDIINALLPVVQANPQNRLVVTGHSLGGALATLAATVLRGSPYNLELDLYTFGSPRVGNYFLARHISRQGMGNNYRVSHIHDPVPGLPLKGLPPFGYFHVWPQWYITSGNNVPVTVNDIDVYNWNEEVMATGDVEPPPGYDTNITTTLDIPNVAAHLWYFRQVSGCTLTAPTSALANLRRHQRIRL